MYHVFIFLGIFVYRCRSVLLVRSIIDRLVVIFFPCLRCFFAFALRSYFGLIFLALRSYFGFIFLALRSWYRTCEHYRFMLENITLNRCILVLVYRDTQIPVLIGGHLFYILVFSSSLHNVKQSIHSVTSQDLGYLVGMVSTVAIWNSFSLTNTYFFISFYFSVSGVTYL